MTEKIIAEKVLKNVEPTRNYDKLIVTSSVPNFEEKHYLSPGTVPATKGDDQIVCRYIVITKD